MTSGEDPAVEQRKAYIGDTCINRDKVSIVIAAKQISTLVRVAPPVLVETLHPNRGNLTPTRVLKYTQLCSNTRHLRSANVFARSGQDVVLNEWTALAPSCTGFDTTASRHVNYIN